MKTITVNNIKFSVFWLGDEKENEKLYGTFSIRPPVDVDGEAVSWPSLEQIEETLCGTVVHDEDNLCPKNSELFVSELLVRIEYNMRQRYLDAAGNYCDIDGDGYVPDNAEVIEDEDGAFVSVMVWIPKEELE